MRADLIGFKLVWSGVVGCGGYGESERTRADMSGHEREQASTSEYKRVQAVTCGETERLTLVKPARRASGRSGRLAGGGVCSDDEEERVWNCL